jgi:hypothetical protein
MAASGERRGAFTAAGTEVVSIAALDAALLEFFAADHALQALEQSINDVAVKRSEAFSSHDPVEFLDAADQYLVARRDEVVERRDRAMLALRELHFQLRETRSYGFGQYAPPRDFKE